MIITTEHAAVTPDRHPMLPPSDEKVCGKCGQSWPCEVAALQQVLDDIEQRIEALGRPWSESSPNSVRDTVRDEALQIIRAARSRAAEPVCRCGHTEAQHDYPRTGNKPPDVCRPCASQGVGCVFAPSTPRAAEPEPERAR